MDFTKSKELQKKSHALIPGGCHTYAKGDDQFPVLAPGFITHGAGCHVWDADGNTFIEYGMGCRAVTLGHGFPSVVKAAQDEMTRGSNFTRPATIELECAEELLGMIEAAESHGDFRARVRVGPTRVPGAVRGPSTPGSRSRGPGAGAGERTGAPVMSRDCELRGGPFRCRRVPLSAWWAPGRSWPWREAHPARGPGGSPASWRPSPACSCTGSRS